MTAIQYRIKGTSNDVTNCDCCGRDQLRRTVALAVLDADRNETETVYYGTSCAARAMAITSRKVTQQAGAADMHRASAARHAEEIIATYGPVETAPVREQAALYFGRNPHMRGKATATDEIARILSEARMALAA